MIDFSSTAKEERGFLHLFYFEKAVLAKAINHHVILCATNTPHREREQKITKFVYFPFTVTVCLLPSTTYISHKPCDTWKEREPCCFKVPFKTMCLFLKEYTHSLSYEGACISPTELGCIPVLPVLVITQINTVVPLLMPFP